MAWWENLGMGQRLARATLVLANATTPIFTITGGRILLTAIFGQITTLIGGAAAYRLQHDPLVGTGTTANLCANTDINAYPVGDQLGITGVPTDALLPAAAAGAVPGMTMPVELPPGDIEVVCATAPGGAVLWTIWFKTLDSGARVVAA